MAQSRAFKSKEGKNEVLNLYDKLLKELTIPHEKITINTSYGDTFAIAAGNSNAPPMVLLHGSSMNSIMWVSDIKEYCKYYRVYAIDLPGEPGRSDERQLPFNTNDYSDWLLDTFEKLRINKAVIIGASLGGWLSAKFAMERSDKVEKLVLICPAGIGRQHFLFIFRALFYMMFGKAGIRKLFKIINGNRDIPNEIILYQTCIGKNFNTRKEPIPQFTDDDLKKLNMPVIVFVGGKDVILRSYETKERLNKLCPNINVELMPEEGHSLINLTGKIIPFLSEAAY